MLSASAHPRYHERTMLRRAAWSVALAYGLLGLAALLDDRLAAAGFGLPVGYVLLVLGLAGFLRWRLALLVTVLSAVIHALIVQQFAARFASLWLTHLASLGVLGLGLLLARVVYIGRLMLTFARRGAQWEALAKPLRIGRRLVIVPAGQRAAHVGDPADVPIFLDPGPSFGTGSHPSTQMCLEFLEQHLRPGQRVLDLGCGTGILSIAAARLGAASVLGVDIEVEAVRATAQNAALNDVAGPVEVRTGSLPDVNARPPAGRPYDLTLANLLGPILVDLLGKGLAETITPQGTLILGGIKTPEAEAVVAASGAAGLQVSDRRERDGWVSLVARWPAAPAAAPPAAGT
jgi:ribosomal protein L11 methyltransferase